MKNFQNKNKLPNKVKIINGFEKAAVGSHVLIVEFDGLLKKHSHLKKRESKVSSFCFAGREMTIPLHQGHIT
jgi:hypothetical protein